MRLLQQSVYKTKVQLTWTHLGEKVLRQWFAGDPGVHGVKLWVPVGQLDAPRRQQLPASELQLIVMDVADISRVVAN